MVTRWQFTEADKIPCNILPFLPERIFDAHTHLFTHARYPEGIPDGCTDVPKHLGLSECRRFISWLHPDKRTKAGLFFGLAFNGDRQADNEVVVHEVRQSQADFKAYGQTLISRTKAAFSKSIGSHHEPF